MEKIITLDHDNIASEHICCAIAEKKCLSGYNKKKDWLQQQFADGLVFKKFDVRGKVFIEYIPAEKAWVPIEAPNYMMINCFWVSGQYQGKGYGKQLYLECLKDSYGKNGIVVITSAKKQPFLNDKKFFQMQGFELADKAEPYFELWHKKLKNEAPIPKFKDIAKHASCNISEGLIVYYTHGCPFTEYYVNTELVNVVKAKGYDLKIVKIETRAQAQSHYVPYTNYSIFKDGKFITHHILNTNYFEKFIEKK